jgi:hypothetical protein
VFLIGIQLWGLLFKLGVEIFTFRKNNEPAGIRILCVGGPILTRAPSLYHSIVGSGTPSALQFSVTGSCRGTTTLRGCSVIFGISNPEKRKKIYVKISTK